MLVPARPMETLQRNLEQACQALQVCALGIHKPLRSKCALCPAHSGCILVHVLAAGDAMLRWCSLMEASMYVRENKMLCCPPSGCSMLSKKIIRAHVRMQDPTSHAAAAQAITAFRDNPAVLPASIYVLENSHSQDACFHAVLALRQAALAAWPRLPLGERSKLRQWALSYAFRVAAPDVGSGVVAASRSALPKAAVALHAVLTKRLWLDLSQEQQVSTLQVCWS